MLNWANGFEAIKRKVKLYHSKFAKLCKIMYNIE